MSPRSSTVVFDASKIEEAIEKAEKEYEKYRVIQDKNYVSDFDKLLLEIKEIEK